MKRPYLTLPKPPPPLPPDPPPASLFNDDSERGIDAPSTHTLQTGTWDEVLRDPTRLRCRIVWLLESTLYYRELDIARNYTYVVPRGVGGRPIVQAKTNCLEGVRVIFDEASKYLIEGWTGRRRRLVVKFRKAEAKACHPRLPTPRVDRNAAMRIEDLNMHQETFYKLGLSTIGIRNQWQMFKEDIKPKGQFDIMPYRLKYMGDLDMDLKDGLLIDISFCECSWHVAEQGRVLELVSAGPELAKTCKTVGSNLKPDCWGCCKIYEVKEGARKI